MSVHDNCYYVGYLLVFFLYKGVFSRPWPETCLGFGQRFSEFGCAAMTSLFWPNVNRSLWSRRLVSRWRIVKSNKRFVNYLLKHDGMIVLIQVYLSSLLLALTSKFYFAKLWITAYILRNVDDWTRRKLNKKLWLRWHSYAVLFLVKNMTSETSSSLRNN